MSRDVPHPLEGAADCFCGLPLDGRQTPWWTAGDALTVEWVECMWCGRSLPLPERRRALS